MGSIVALPGDVEPGDQSQTCGKKKAESRTPTKSHTLSPSRKGGACDEHYWAARGDIVSGEKAKSGGSSVGIQEEKMRLVRRVRLANGLAPCDCGVLSGLRSGMVDGTISLPWRGDPGNHEWHV